ncbi:MAG: aminotransferase class, partial [Chloroflexi bacterium]|nr:aminotransferase class [Chloroflexota bacterium]
LRPVQRILMAPGPTDVDPSVLRVLSAPVLGHTDPEFFSILADIGTGLRQTFQTQNPLTLALTSSGTGAMEACLANVIEPGDRVVVGVAGYFAERLALIAERLGANVVRVTAPWGSPVDPGDLRRALGDASTKVLALVHGETSTGVLQPLQDMGKLAHEHGALLLVDTVPTLAGIDVQVDAWDIDMCYSGSQKCISAPPGLALVTFGDRAVAAMKARRTPVSFYFDLQMLERYWYGDHMYHHTPSISLYYALREALRLIKEEGIAERIERHRMAQTLLLDLLAEIGLEPMVEPDSRLVTVTTVRIPEGVDDLSVRRALLQDYGIEITGGLGELKGRIWRIGLMGYSCQERNVLLVTSALKAVLSRQRLGTREAAISAKPPARASQAL